MLPAARDAQIDFIRLVGEEPSGLYFEDFLRGGFQAWPRPYCERFPGLASWNGVAGLKRRLRILAGAPNDWQTLIASRSLPLLKLGASCLFRVCRNVLTTDLSWPTYQQAIVDRAASTGNRVVTTAIRDHILRGGWDGAAIVNHMAEEFARHGCDGLLLPAVDHLGIRLPIGQIVRRIKGQSELRFLLVDAAQAYCHIPLDECIAHADLVVAGCHKWMGACLPVGIAFYGQQRSRELIERRVRRCNDPLIRFVEELDGSVFTGRSETASIQGLFAASGAASAQLPVAVTPAEQTTVVDELLVSAPRPCDCWNPVVVAPTLRTRIAILERAYGKRRKPSATAVRREWFDAGCIVTGYQSGFARLAFARGENRAEGQ